MSQTIKPSQEEQLALPDIVPAEEFGQNVNIEEILNRQLGQLSQPKEPDLSTQLIEAAKQRREAYEHFVTTDEPEPAAYRLGLAFNHYADVAGYDDEQRASSQALLQARIEDHLGHAVEIWPDSQSTLFDQENVSLEQTTSPEETMETLLKILAYKRKQYAKLTALNRTKVKATAADQINLETARKEYEAVRDAVGLSIAGEAFNEGATEEDVNAFSVAGAVEELDLLEKEIVKERSALADSKKLKFFYDWWARQGGKRFLKGRIQKSAFIGAIGIASGAVAGAAGSLALGPVAGLGAGVLVARSVTRGLAAAKIDKEANTVTMAHAQSDRQLLEAQQKIKIKAGQLGAGKTVETKDLTQLIEANTDKEISRNRNRLLGAAAIGLAMGIVGAGVGLYLHDHWLNSKNTTVKKVVPPRSPAKPAPTQPAPKPPVTVRPPAVPRPTPLAPVAPTTPNIPSVNVNQWSWDVAHQLHPGQEEQFMNNALAHYSSETGLSARLVPWNGTTMIQVGNHIVNPAEMARINTIMVGLG